MKYFIALILGLLMVVSPVEAQLGPPNQSAGISIAWDANSETNIVAYKLYMGGSSRLYTNVVNVGNVLITPVEQLKLSSTYYFAVTAVNSAGLESDFSLEVSYTTPTRPAPPGNIRIPNGSHRIIVSQLQISPSIVGPWEEWASTEQEVPDGVYVRAYLTAKLE